MSPAALKALGKADPVLRKLIRKIGPCELIAQKRRSPFESLVRAVAHQQLHGAAAEKILGRFQDLFPGKRFPSAVALAGISDEALRTAGFSGAKSAALRDIAAKTISGAIPANREINKLSDDEIVARLIAVRGIGRWTAEMLLIFQLGRPDVLPADDYGVRNGFRVAFDLPDLPSPKTVLERGERWRPFRTTAAWYLWRAADASKDAGKI